MTDNNVTMPDKGTRFLWCSVGRHHPTGYGSQTRLFLPRIKAAGGFDLFNFAFTDNIGSPIEDDGIVTLGTRYQGWGNDVIAAHMDFIKAQFSFGLFDFYMAEPSAWGMHPHAHWTPVDADPLRTDLDKNLRPGARWVIAMSKFGERVLRDAGYDPLYVPHGIETKVFKPIDRKEARARFQKQLDADAPQFDGRKYDLDDKFLIVMVAMNSDVRKGFYEALVAYKAFHEAHPDSLLYLHTNMVGITNGDNLFDQMKALKIDPATVAYPNQYLYDMGMLNDGFMNDLYNVADVLFQPSYGEGFGIPIVEAQAAGSPVIVTDCSSMSELCLSGIKVPGIKYSRFPGLFWTRPLIDPLVGALETIYKQKREPEVISAKVQHYDIDKVFAEYMLPALQQIAAEAIDAEKMLDRKNATRKSLTVNGVELVVRANTYDEIIAHEVQQVYCPDLIDYPSLKRVVDIGAHIGTFSAWVKHVAPQAQIVAVEAMERNAELLRLNTNGQRGKDITVMVGRAGYGQGEYNVQIPFINSGGYTLVKKDGPEVTRRGESIASERPYEGRTISLKEALDMLGAETDADLLKLDCEGGEFDILLNAPPGDLMRFRWIVGEYHSDMGNIGEFLARMVGLGFSVRRLKPTASNLGIFCLERIDNAKVSQPANG